MQIYGRFRPCLVIIFELDFLCLIGKKLLKEDLSNVNLLFLQFLFYVIMFFAQNKISLSFKNACTLD